MLGRRHGAIGPGLRWGKSAPRVRCGTRPMAPHRALRRACLDKPNCHHQIGPIWSECALSFADRSGRPRRNTDDSRRGHETGEDPGEASFHLRRDRRHPRQRSGTDFDVAVPEHGAHQRPRALRVRSHQRGAPRVRRPSRGSGQPGPRPADVRRRRRAVPGAQPRDRLPAPSRSRQPRRRRQAHGLGSGARGLRGIPGALGALLRQELLRVRARRRAFRRRRRPDHQHAAGQRKGATRLARGRACA